MTTHVNQSRVSHRRAARAGTGLCVLLAVVLVSGPAAARAERYADAERGGDEEPGLRFTPGMARAFGGIYARQVLKSRYELPDDKIEQAQEMAARRMMQLAHKLDEPGRELVERFIEEQLAFQGQEGGPRFMPPSFGKEFADRVLPILPEVNDMVRGLSQDVRPMLPMKQQLKMAADLMAFKTGIDGFESTMRKWSSGEITDYRDPFRGEREIKRDQDGQSERLKSARNSARVEADNLRSKAWERYVAKFKQLYALDAAQAATADSILREFSQREELMRADAERSGRIYEGRLWTNMAKELDDFWSHPARFLIEDFVARNQQPLQELEDSFKTRLESIPTTAQRRAVEQKVAALIEEKGLKLPEVTE